MILFPRIFISVAIFSSVFLAYKPLMAGGNIDQEILLGGYVSTPRNLETRGGTAAYRIWLMPEEDQDFSIIYPRPLTVGFEIRGGCLWEPEDNWEAGIMIDLKYEFDLNDNIAIYLLGSTGGNYSGIDYEAVATHYNFTSRGSLGIRLFQLILQTSYEHRSNAGFRQPNRGIDLITVSLGYRF